MDIKEAAEILLKAEEIKKDPVLFKAAQEKLKVKAQTINSIADLKMLREKGLTKRDLLTDDDKATLQQKIEEDKKLEEMGFKVKDKVNFDEESEDIFEDDSEDEVETEEEDE